LLELPESHVSLHIAIAVEGNIWNKESVARWYARNFLLSVKENKELLSN